ncbi:MAG: hypothetical protein IPL53_10885 [Ignavibacteria bacterium]|nr:hypothetical protein [Ignavibacteria bacterium]
MKNLFLSVFITSVLYILISGCGKKDDPFTGNVYFHDADSLAFIAGFDKDTLFYIIRGPKLNQSHKTKYKMEKVNDSTYLVEVEKKPVFWEKNTWEIVHGKGDDKGFYSAESRNYYQYSPDKNILR